MAAALQAFSVQSFAAVAYIVWASTLLGYVAWNYLLSRYPVTRIAPFTLLVPLLVRWQLKT
jgi:O-acetylserine/cysteine efflux transporter